MLGVNRESSDTHVGLMTSQPIFARLPRQTKRVLKVNIQEAV